VPTILGAMSEGTPIGDELTPQQAAELLYGGRVQLVDVRRIDEWQAVRVAESVHLPLDELPHRAAEIDRGRPVVFICRSGSRSGMATAAFRASGFEAYNLVGGIEAWIASGLAIEPDSGEVARPRPDNS
jgi:rhodanese-related sulfurtransferase